MFGIGGTEFLIILLFAFIIFGPDQLPKIAKTLGRALRQFQQASEEVTKVVKAEIYDPDDKNDPINQNIKSILTGEKPSQTAQPKQAAPQAAPETFAERKARLAREREAAAARTPHAPMGEDGTKTVPLSAATSRKDGDA